MKALIVIEIPEDHLAVTLNDLYERLNGYKCDLKPMPEPRSETIGDDMPDAEAHGWNLCIEELEK